MASISDSIIINLIYGKHPWQTSWWVQNLVSTFCLNLVPYNIEYCYYCYYQRSRCIIKSPDTCSYNLPLMADKDNVLLWIYNTYNLYYLVTCLITIYNVFQKFCIIIFKSPLKTVLTCYTCLKSLALSSR